MSNPAISFIDLVDQYGTQVSAYAVRFAGGIGSSGYRLVTEPVVFFVQTVLTWAIWILDLVINQGLFLEIFGSVYQVLLDTVYRFVNPLIIATFAFMFLMARIYIGDKVNKDDKSGRITGFDLNYSSFSDEAHGKKIGTQLANTAILMFIIIVAMANPFTLLTKIFALINQLVGQLAPASTGSSPQVDGVLAPMLQLINYQSVLAPACNESWSTTLATGGNVAKLACLTAEEKEAATASAVSFGLSIISIVMIAGFAYFSWIILMRFSWMLYRMIVHIAVVPWEAALLIANPGSERKKLDTIKDRFLEAAKSLFWLLVTVFVAAALPAALLTALDLVNMPAFVTMLLSSGLFYFAGRVANKRIGRKWKRDKEGNRVEIHDGTTGWNDFRINGGMGKWLAQPFNDAQKASEAELAMSAAIIDGTRETTGAAHGAQAGVKLGNAEVNPGMDEAVRTVTLTSDQPTVTAELSSSRDGVAADGEPAGGDTENSDFIGSARDFAAAATAAVIADAHARSDETSSSAVTAPTFLAPADGVRGDTAHVAATGAAALAGSAALTASLADSGGRHHLVDAEIPAGQEYATDTAASITEPVDPTATRRQMIESYIGAVQQISVDPDVVAEAVVATSAARAVESTAFHRIAKVYDNAKLETDDQPTTQGVVGGSGEFLEKAQRHVEWVEYQTLAKSLGMNLDPVSRESTENRPDITFYASSDEGENEVRYRGRDGFGDTI